MSFLPEFSSLVATLYDAAADPGQWGRFVDEFYLSMGSTRGCLASIAEDPELASVTLRGYTDTEIGNYAEYFYQHDIVLDAGMEAIQRGPQLVGPVEAVLPSSELLRSEIYNDYYRSLGMHYASCMMLGRTGAYTAIGLAAWRPKSSGPFEQEQLHLVDLLTPHVRQAFLLQARLKRAHLQTRAFESALEATAVAVIALGTDGSILAVSGPAETLLRGKQLLTQRAGRLHAVSPEKDRALQQMMHWAGRTSDLETGVLSGKAPDVGGSLLLPHPERPQPMQVQVMAARPGGRASEADPAVLVFVSDPGATPPSRGQTLQQLYRLTPVEARLADLFLQGRELKQAAEQLRLTYENTRFHLKQIFRKTNTKRQTDLLRLLLAIRA